MMSCFFISILFCLLCLLRWFFFFFKQKTAYEMRISDWSSDVCSSDLTCGLFEREMKAISDAVHAAGGYVYCDGANFNAIVGRVRPGDLGVDAMHINQIGRASCRERVCQYV